MRQATHTSFQAGIDTASSTFSRSGDSAGDVPATLSASDGLLVGPRALLLAVLEDAIHCAGLTTTDRRPELGRLRSRARLWIRSRDQDWLFSFESVCDALQIDARRLRRRVLQDAPQTPTGGRRRRIHGLPRPSKKLERA